MATKRMETAVRAGGVVGFLSFLVVGLKPAIVYGGMTGVVLAAAVLGGPIEGGELITRVLVGGGMLLSVVAVASVMTVLGAVVVYLGYLAIFAALPKARALGRGHTKLGPRAVEKR